MKTINKPILMVFTKYPEPGKVKTRLAQDIGKTDAAMMYMNMAELVLHRTSSQNYRQVVYYDPPEKKQAFIQWLGLNRFYKSQPEGDLGERILHCFQCSDNTSTPCIILIGSDCLEVTENDILTAIKSLKNNDCVIGPAYDGGYYLLGLSYKAITKSGPNLEKLFKDISWSTPDVLKETLSRLDAMRLTYVCLDMKRDIDTVEDYQNYLQQMET